MVLLIVRHYVGRLVEAVVGGWGLARAVQPGKFGGAYLLRAGGAGEPAAMLHPAVLTGAAGGGRKHSVMLPPWWQRGGLLGHLPITPAGDTASRSPGGHQCPGAADRRTAWQTPPSRTIAGFVILNWFVPHTCTSVLKKLKALDLQVWGKLTKWKDIGHQGRTQGFS